MTKTTKKALDRALDYWETSSVYNLDYTVNVPRATENSRERQKIGVSFCAVFAELVTTRMEQKTQK